MIKEYYRSKMKSNLFLFGLHYLEPYFSLIYMLKDNISSRWEKQRYQTNCDVHLSTHLLISQL